MGKYSNSVRGSFANVFLKKVAFEKPEFFSEIISYANNVGVPPEKNQIKRLFLQHKEIVSAKIYETNKNLDKGEEVPYPEDYFAPIAGANHKMVEQVPFKIEYFKIMTNNDNLIFITMPRPRKNNIGIDAFGVFVVTDKDYKFKRYFTMDYNGFKSDAKIESIENAKITLSEWKSTKTKEVVAELESFAEITKIFGELGIDKSKSKNK